MIKWIICLIYGHNYGKFAGSLKLRFLHFFYSNQDYQPTQIQKISKMVNKVVDKLYKTEHLFYNEK